MIGMSNPETFFTVPGHRLRQNFHRFFPQTDYSIPKNVRTIERKRIGAIREHCTDSRLSRVSAQLVLYSATDQYGTTLLIPILTTCVRLAAFASTAGELFLILDNGVAEATWASLILVHFLGKKETYKRNPEAKVKRKRKALNSKSEMCQEKRKPLRQITERLHIHPTRDSQNNDEPHRTLE